MRAAGEVVNGRHVESTGVDIGASAAYPWRMARPKKKRPTETHPPVFARVDPDVIARLDAAAARYSVTHCLIASRSDIVRRAVIEYLARDEAAEAAK